MNQKMKRIFAWIGIILLALLYLVTFILGVAGNESTTGWFMASLACSVVVPCLMYLVPWLIRVFETVFRKKENKQEKKQENKQ